MNMRGEVAGVAHVSVRTGMKRFLIVGICLVMFPLRMFSQASIDTIGHASQDSSRTAAGTWMVVGALVEGVSITSHTHIPYLGAGHFVQGDWLNGTLFLGSEVGLLVLENSLRARVGPGDFGRYPAISNGSISVKSNGLSPASEAMKQYADLAQHSEFYVRLLDFYSAYRGFHARTSLLNKVRLPEESVPSLMLSPFKPKYLTDPWVFAPALLAGVVSFIDAGNNRSLSSVREMTMLNANFSPTGAAFVHGGIDAYRYTVVASGEEMFFRGALQTELTERTDPALAVGLSSLLFGAWHIPNNGVSGALAATAGGLYLGYRYETSGYDLGEVIAIHFWLDFITSVMEFIQNPRNGRFVYGITWKL
jgi:membrane protease YdiL (CAAX protease family)